MKLLVIIVSYNTKDITLSCINSVEKYSPQDTRIIVVDNNSTDGSPEALNKTSIILINNDQNLGFSKAVNQGIKLSKGEYVLILNSDTKVKRDSINRLIEFAENNGDCGAVGPKLLNSNNSVQASSFNFPTIWGAIQEYWLGIKGKHSKFVPPGVNPVQVESLVMACLLITPQAIKKVGLLDEKFFMYYEDIDYCKRIRKAGLRVYYLPEAEVIHYHGVSGKDLASTSDQWRRLITSSKKYNGL